jgi:hypothetical protein
VEIIEQADRWLSGRFHRSPSHKSYF